MDARGAREVAAKPLDVREHVVDAGRVRVVVAGRVAVEAVAALRALGDAEGLEDAVVVEGREALHARPAQIMQVVRVVQD